MCEKKTQLKKHNGYVEADLPLGRHGCAAGVNAVSGATGKFQQDVEAAGNVIASAATARARRRRRACQHPSAQRTAPTLPPRHLPAGRTHCSMGQARFLSSDMENTHLVPFLKYCLSNSDVSLSSA